MTRSTFPGFPAEGIRFLRQLKRNNNRDWFQAQKNVYENTIKQPMLDLISAMASAFERFAPEMAATPRVSAYRIYRDTRFSKDKSPYKTHVAAVFPRKGLNKHGGAGLYVHISPEDVFAGGGLYMPLPEDLNAVRRHISENRKRFSGIVEHRTFRRLFGELSGDQLSRVPRGFRADDPAAHYLRFKQFLAGRDIDPGIVITPKFFKTVVTSFEGMMPLIRFLNEPILKLQRIRERQESMMDSRQ
jgi:uncharacterized protein (TIGR02453 family)